VEQLSKYNVNRVDYDWLLGDLTYNAVLKLLTQNKSGVRDIDHARSFCLHTNLKLNYATRTFGQFLFWIP